jgi:hypothetical protein
MAVVELAAATILLPLDLDIINSIFDEVAQLY